MTIGEEKSVIGGHIQAFDGQGEGFGEEKSVIGSHIEAIDGQGEGIGESMAIVGGLLPGRLLLTGQIALPEQPFRTI